MNKNILGIITLVVSVIGVLVGYYYNFSPEQVSANPDYICVKSVSNQPCEISSCGEWQTDGSRTCIGNKATKVAYYLIRTSCEAGYTKISKGGNVGGASGRHGGDYTYSSSTCSINEIDNVAPIGDIK